MNTKWNTLLTPARAPLLHADYDGLQRVIIGMVAPHIPGEIDAIREARLSATVVFKPADQCGARGELRIPATGDWMPSYRPHAEAFAKEMGYDFEVWQ